MQRTETCENVQKKIKKNYTLAKAWNAKLTKDKNLSMLWFSLLQ